MDDFYTVKGIDGDSTMNRAAYEEHIKARDARRARGRYTIEEAALFIHEKTGSQAKTMQSKLVKAIQSHKLPTYPPNQDDKYMYGEDAASCIRTFYEEVKGADLNKWLAEYEPDLVCHFPEPQLAADLAKAGRYELGLAAWQISEGHNVLCREILDRLISDAFNEKLPVYDRETHLRYSSPATKPHPEVYWVALWSDLNKWIELFRPDALFRFTEPSKPTAKENDTPPGNDWREQALAIADKIALKRWHRGEREITARNICDAVATELAKDSTTHGIRGPRVAGSIRNQALKGWKFNPPTGTNGTSGTKK